MADYLVGKGLPFRDAHRVAGRLVALLAGQGRPLCDATLDELQGLSPLFDEDYYAVVDLDRVVAGKMSPGGTAPRRVAEQLALAREVLSRLQRRRPPASGSAHPCTGARCRSILLVTMGLWNSSPTARTPVVSLQAPRGAVVAPSFFARRPTRSAPRLVGKILWSAVSAAAV